MCGLMVSTAVGNTSRVYPSGFAWATTAAPTEPPAPPRFSITTACPSTSPSFCATGRAELSELPPGG